jgi:hypothetical protein
MEQPIEQAKFSKKEARKLLKIVHQGVWNSHLKTVGLDPEDNISLSWENLEDLLALQLFLKAGLGRHSKADFARLRKKGREAVEKTLLRLQVPFELEKKLLVRRYQKQVMPNQPLKAEASKKEAEKTENLTPVFTLTS